MFGMFRAARVVVALTMLVSAFAAPAVAAEAGAIQLASLASVPQVVAQGNAPAFQPQESASAAPLVAPQLSAPAAVLEPAPVVETTSSTTAPGTIATAVARVVRPLRDLVIAFVNFDNQDAEQDCLAKAVYFEARGESLEGQLAVAEVVLNRAGSGRYPPTICDVVTQPAQFSFIRAGKFPIVDKSSEAWHKAAAIADIASKRLAQQIAPNVLWYHASYVAPSWGRRLTRVAQIGTHIFYS